MSLPEAGSGSDFRDLQLLIRSHVPILVVETHDENRAREMMTRLAIREALPLFVWSVTEGLQRLDFGELPSSDALLEPEAMLRAVKAHREPALYLLCDLHPYLSDPRLVRLLKDVALRYRELPRTLVLLSHRLGIPPELTRLAARVELSLPDEEEIVAIVREEAQRWQEANGGQRVRTDSRTLAQLTRSLRGLTHADCRRLVRNAIFDDGSITESELPEINRAKFELMNLDGVLSFEYRTERFADVAGVGRLRAWLDQRREAATTTMAQQIDRPHGVLLLGVQGAGKSVSARAIAGAWSLPLLRLDMGALYNKYIGETERNLRESLRSAELMAPCVLWLDEIEKGIGAGDADAGVSRRVLGSLLTWMSEQRGGVFVVATANDVALLPPELLRKGRFDEIFFVDLPDEGTRAEIFGIHLRRRGIASEDLDVAALAAASAGFSGAEIEQVVVGARYRAAAAHQSLDGMHLLSEIRATVPLSVTMAERMDALRHWAAGRTVPAA
ncbi:MAG TPA: AAA family ATPase [Pseudomonadales bacterium]|nr:AAA family ATPase [Pseudomonadales bacterium]HNC69616.1 AAA family ATPase [Pseudomonadales bacterium]